MNEPAIRQWAWAEFKGWGKNVVGEDGNSSFKTFTDTRRLYAADLLAAWVMSGALPPTTDA